MWNGYENRNRREKKVRPAYVSINRRYEIVLNPEAHRLIDGANYVELFYDSETQRIGIRWPQRDYRHRIFIVRHCGRKGRMCVVRTRRFLCQFGVQIDQTLVFKDLWQEEGPMLVLDLTTARALDWR